MVNNNRLLHVINECAHDATGPAQQLRRFAGDSHDDFKPQFKDTSSSSSAIDTVEQDLKAHKVFVYMKVHMCCNTWQLNACTKIHRVCQTHPSVGFPMRRAASSTPMVCMTHVQHTYTHTHVPPAPGVKYGSRNVLSDPEIREAIKKYSSWPTIPQVFVEGELLGGSDILYDMHKSGQLMSVVERVQGSDPQ